MVIGIDLETQLFLEQSLTGAAGSSPNLLPDSFTYSVSGFSAPVAAADPFGGNNADSFVSGAAPSSPRARLFNSVSGITYEIGQQITFSVYAYNLAGAGGIILRNDSLVYGASSYDRFSTVDGTVVTKGTSETAHTTDIGGGWWLLGWTDTVTATSGNPVDFELYSSDAAGNFVSTSLTELIRVYKPKLELGATPTRDSRGN